MNLYEMLKARKVGWSNDFLANIYAKAIASHVHNYTGQIPYTFTANGEPLINWVITGNSGGVGTKTANMFDGIVRNALISDSTGEEIGNEKWRCSNFIEISDSSATLKWESDSAYYQAKLGYYAADNSFLSTQVVQGNNKYSGTFTIPEDCKYVKVSYSVSVSGNPVERNNIMFNEGNTAIDYEPYGYKILVSCGNATTPIYIGNTPLLENETISKTLSNVNIPTVEGSNTISISSTIQPSKIYIKWKG